MDDMINNFDSIDDSDFIEDEFINPLKIQKQDF